MPLSGLKHYASNGMREMIFGDVLFSVGGCRRIPCVSSLMGKDIVQYDHYHGRGKSECLHSSLIMKEDDTMRAWHIICHS